MASSFSHEAYLESRRQIKDIIVPTLREQHYCFLGPCLHADINRDMIDKIDVVCEHCDDPSQEVTLGVRCQKGRYSSMRTHTLTWREVDLLKDHARDLPTYAVHAYLDFNESVVAIGVIHCHSLRHCVDLSRYKFLPSNGRPDYFIAIPWRDYPMLFRVYEPTPAMWI